MNDLPGDLLLPWELPVPQNSEGTGTGSDADKSVEIPSKDSVNDADPSDEDKAGDPDGETKSESEDGRDEQAKPDNDANAEEDDEVEGDDEDDVVFEIDGEKISRKEGRDGYLRHADATKKWQAAAEVRKEATASRDEYLGKLENVNRFLALVTPDQKKLLDAAQKEQEAEFGKLRESKIAESEEKLRESVPEWVDEDRMESDLRKLFRDTEKTYGFTEDEVRAVVDHRAILLMRDAAELHRLKKEQASVKDKKVRTDSKNSIRPKAKSRRPASDRARAEGKSATFDRLRQTGSTEDALAALRYLQEG